MEERIQQKNLLPHTKLFIMNPEYHFHCPPDTEPPILTPKRKSMSVYESPVQFNFSRMRHIDPITEERIVTGIILDSDRFYSPEKRKLKRFTSSGRKIVYPLYILRRMKQENFHKRNKSFLYSGTVKDRECGSNCDDYDDDDDEVFTSDGGLSVIPITEKFIFMEKLSYSNYYQNRNSKPQRVVSFQDSNSNSSNSKSPLEENSRFKRRQVSLCSFISCCLLFCIFTLYNYSTLNFFLLLQF